MNGTNMKIEIEIFTHSISVIRLNCQFCAFLKNNHQESWPNCSFGAVTEQDYISNLHFLMHIM